MEIRENKAYGFFKHTRLRYVFVIDATQALSALQGEAFHGRMNKQLTTSKYQGRKERKRKEKKRKKKNEMKIKEKRCKMKRK